MINSLDGIIAVCDTPFTETDEIDHASLKRYVRNAMKGGVVGFLVPAKAAEVEKLTFTERMEMVSTVLQESNGEVVVIGGTAAPNQEERIKYASSLIEMGCPGVLVSTPFLDRDSFKKSIYEIAELNPGFLMIQDWDFEGYGIPVNLIVELFHELECFKCLKVEVVPAGVKYSEIINATKGALHVSGGWAGGQMIEGLDRGVNAFMPTILLEVYNRIYQFHRNGERERAKNIFYDLLTILAFSHQHLDISIHFGKRYYHHLGIFSTIKVRQPILAFDAFHERVAQEMIERAVALSDSLSNY